MDGRSILAAACLLSAFASALLAGKLVFGSATKASRSLRVQKRAGAGRSVRLLNDPPRVCSVFAEKLLSSPRVDAWAKSVCAAAAMHGVEALPEGVVSVCAIAAFFLVAASAVSGRVALGVLLVAGIVFAAGTWAGHVAETRRERMRDALPDALQSMSSCFGAGFTLLQTFSHLAQETDGPLAEQFAHAEGAMRTGSSPAEALAHIRDQGGIEELSFVAVALSVQHQTGGSMQRVIDATRDSLKQELELRRSLRVHTAQAKLSARVVVGVTVGLVAAMMLLSRDFLSPFFESAMGMALLAVAVSMQVAGVVSVRKLLKVEVG